MTKYIDSEKLKAEIEGIIAVVTTKNHPDEFGTVSECMAAAEIEALNLILEIISELQQEQMKQEDKQNLWHSLDEEPKYPNSTYESLCSILVLYDNGNMFLYRYDEGGRPNDMFTPPFSCIENAKWCYCNDLIP